MSITKKQLTLCIMVKDEISQIEKTLVSCLPLINSVIVLDTGSVDGTQYFINTWCNKHHLPVEIYEEPFIDFSTSKNKMLKYANNSSISKDFFLLLDSNDELKNLEELELTLKSLDLLEKQFLCEINSLTLKFKCVYENKNLDFTRRVLIKKNSDFYFKYPVHEELISETNYKNFVLNETFVFHNKEIDKPSENRFYKDIDVIQKFLEKNPNDKKMTFYLAQSYFGVKNYEQSLFYYLKRTELSEHFEYECLQSYINAFKLVTSVLQIPKEHLEIYKNEMLKYNQGRLCEPFYLISLYYYKNNEFEEALEYSNRACLTEEQTSKEWIIEKNIYEIDRWELLKLCKQKIETSFL